MFIGLPLDDVDCLFLGIIVDKISMEFKEFGQLLSAVSLLDAAAAGHFNGRAQKDL